jgi:hypothetical protein
MTKLIFVTGMFRSGTTLIARMLNAHPNIAFASDPFARLFRAFRNEVGFRTFDPESIDTKAPLDDYYFFADKQRFMRAIQEEPLAVSAAHADLVALRQDIANASRPFSPKIEPLLGQLTGDNFIELFRQGFDIINQAYGDANSLAIGFKEVWTTEFSRHILEAFPEAKVIHIMRDPRAVCASKNVTEAKYPWLFLTRQWRKLAALAWINVNDPAFKKRTRLIRFEDLLAQPVEHTHALCDFMEIPFHQNLIDPSSFVDGAGNPWHQNSSHFEGKQQFNRNSVDKWRKVLAPVEVQFIETICYPEMKVFGYESEYSSSPDWPLSLIFSPPHVQIADLARWIVPYSPQHSEDVTRELALEQMRSRALLSSSQVSPEDKCRFGLSTEFFDHLQQRCLEG